MKKSTTAAAVAAGIVIAMSSGSAGALQVPAPNTVSATCYAEHQTRSHIKPRANCEVALRAAPGYVLVPRTLKIDATGHRHWHEAPRYEYGGKGGLSDIAPTVIRVLGRCRGSRGIGARCKIGLHVTAVQVPISGQ